MFSRFVVLVSSVAFVLSVYVGSVWGLFVGFGFLCQAIDAWEYDGE